MYNSVTLLGRVATDLALKTTPQGTSVLTFVVACDRRYQEKGKDKKSDFFNCVAWCNEAEFISRFWAKGKPIFIEGELQNRKYTDKNGIERYVTEVIVNRAVFTGDSSNSGNRPPLPEEPPQARAENSAAREKSPSERTYTADDFKVSEPTDDDYPF